MSTLPQISLTPRAAEHVRKHLRDQGSARGLRLGVRQTGCAGYQYVVEVARELRAQDQVFESNGIQVVVDATSMVFLAGMQVDYGRQGLNEGFEFKNPNVSSSCGCGESIKFQQPVPLSDPADQEK